MTPFPLLASDMSGLVVVPLAIILMFVVWGVVSCLLIARWGRRRWWGFALAMVPTAVGGLLLVSLALEGAMAMLYVAAAIPFLVGASALWIWSRPKRSLTERR